MTLSAPVLRRVAASTARRAASHSRLVAHALSPGFLGERNGNLNAPPATLNSLIAAKSLSTKPDHRKTTMTEEELADHSWRQINHVWSEAELNEKFATKDLKFVPVTTGDKLANVTMNALYKTFNLITGYREVNPPTS